MRQILSIAAIFVVLSPTLGRAQMALPGAVVTPTPVGQAAAPPGLHRARSSAPGDEVAYDRHFVAAKPPAVETVVGKPFALSGSRGALLVEKSDSELRLTRLTLTGDKISAPNQVCEVAMGGAEPLILKPLGTPDGAQRFELESSACPLQFDVLSGALRATSPTGACAFPQADCRVDATGLWGPAGDAFGESQVKSIERERTALEKAVRSHFRGLLHRIKKDKAATKAAVKEQADFGASRSQTCSDYDREDTHGFCALRLTEARDFRLQARLAEQSVGKEKKKTAKLAKRPRVAAPALAPATPAPK